MIDLGRQTMPETEAASGEQMQIEGIEMVENIDLDDYEIVSAEFFAQVREPAFTINVNKITANAACVRLLPDVDYVKILVNQKEKKLVLKPCDELDISGYKWARMKDGRRYASQRTGEPFVLIICKLMGWNPDYRYKILGKKNKANGEDVLVFDLTVAQVFEKPAPGENGKGSRRAIMPAGWNGRFGPKFGENKRTLQVDTFSGYTVFSIKGDKKKKTEALPEVADERDSDTVPSEKDPQEENGQLNADMEA